MPDDDLQSIVDEVADRLQRSVAIDDPGIRLLAVSRHFGDEDPVRVTSVLNRSLGPELVEGILAQGIAQWTRPGTVEVNADAALPRLCVPVRCSGLLLGYLWLIDTDRSLDADEVGLAEDAAARAGVVLYRRLLLHERSKARHEAILRELVSSDHSARVQAVDDLRAEHLFPDHAQRLRVLAVQLRGDDPAAGVALESAIEEGLRAVGDVHLTATNRARAWVLLAERSDRSADAVCSRIVARFRALTGDDAHIVIGVSTLVEDLGQVVDSYRQALLAARAALLVPSLGDVARWGQLGPYEVLLKLRIEDLVPAADVPALAELERRDAHGVLLETLEAFFENAGDVRRTADGLCVHRATLYHRLKRIEEHTGCRLDRGDDRLTLHLGIKLRKLAAAYRTQARGAPIP